MLVFPNWKFIRNLAIVEETFRLFFNTDQPFRNTLYMFSVDTFKFVLFYSNRIHSVASLTIFDAKHFQVK